MSKNETIGSFFYVNDNIKPIDDFDEKYLHGDDIIYEVMRMIDGIPLFFEDHYIRLGLSCKLISKTLSFKSESLNTIINQLADKNNIYNGNIKIILYPDGDKKIVIVHFMYAVYPDTLAYTHGVNAKIYFSERHRPNAKIYNALWRKALGEFIARNQLSEAILVNKHNQITEASRSNLFFIVHNVLYSTPEKYVLPGITRKKTIQLAAKLGIEYKEKIFKLKELPNFDALLLSSTSKKLLPIKQVGNFEFNPQNSIAQRLIIAFFELEKEYIKNVNLY